MSSLGGRIVFAGAFSAALAVVLGAFGAHALDGRVSLDLLANYETGARYHFYHSLGIVAVGLLAMLVANRTAAQDTAARTAATLLRLRRSAVLMVAGIVLFSGSLYVMALTGQLWLGAVTPLGGVSFIAAWALFAWAARDA